jgi:cytochrome bd-type quinol oxidase subunit 1
MPVAKKEESIFSREIRIIPWWAYVLAVVVFVGAQVLLHFLGFRREHNPPPFPFRVFFTVMMGCLVAFLALLIGYVNRDAKRRNMNSTLWTVLVIFIPNAIGFILYFLLRQPVLVQCPQCAERVNPNYNFCPKCKFHLRPTCPMCQRAIQPGDAYCPYCAHELKAATA